MEIHISDELKYKLTHEIKMEFIGEWDYNVVLEFDDTELHLYNECIEWRNKINLYSLSDQEAGIKKLLFYDYVRPRDILHNKVIFSYEFKKDSSWQKYFTMEDDFVTLKLAHEKGDS